ncbi:hypothetical protein PMIN01_11596 [Paraphaeosphaeria minitans]|uniref:Uncharacterized protein n=1 Tax=Paraphaeosphaeria minitans TaxID=565426 RepID=A0A9P6G7V6_9PLEO|nr:hypothetical protein PMIN01_11596 [Paraphaeosphaeria minitans]
MVAGWLAGWPKGGWAMGDGLAAFAAVQNGVRFPQALLSHPHTHAHNPHPHPPPTSHAPQSVASMPTAAVATRRTAPPHRCTAPRHHTAPMSTPRHGHYITNSAHEHAQSWPSRSSQVTTAHLSLVCLVQPTNHPLHTISLVYAVQASGRPCASPAESHIVAQRIQFGSFANRSHSAQPLAGPFCGTSRNVADGAGEP